MHFVFEKMKQFFPSLNKRVLTEKSFFRVAKKFRVEILYLNIPYHGLYVPSHITGLKNRRNIGQPAIVIDMKSNPFVQLYICFHELVHVILHESPPMILACKTIECDFSQKQNLNTERRFEMEAHAFASAALIPEAQMHKQLETNLFYDPSQFERDLHETRWSLHQNYKK